VNAREKEAYLREYEVLKKKGKPFFPYAVGKDATMMFIVAVVLVVMSLVLGAEQGPKADPTTTTYVPRPEWYFFFLFELLRVIKPPELVPVATVGIPTLCMVLLLLLPFYDRGPERHPLRRPIAMTAAVATVAAMAYLTVLGALAGPPSEIALKTKPEFKKGQEVMAASGCLGCHKVGENGNTLGPNLTNVGDRLGRQAIARTLVNPPSFMPNFKKLQQEKPQQFDELVRYVASLKSGNN
jgi:menaquinol-cytochrome c reductase cytochrome b/c subunit